MTSAHLCPVFYSRSTSQILCSRFISWWRHQMETFSALLAIGAGNSPVPGESPTQRPVTRSFDVFSDLRLNKRLSKQSWGWWLETLSRPFWRHRNVLLWFDTDRFRPISPRASSLSGRTSYRKISWSLEAARLDAVMIVSFNIWQASRQRCCQDACQISELLEKSKPESLGFETSRDLAVRCPSVWWIKAQGDVTVAMASTVPVK